MKMNQLLELSGKDFKAAIIKILQQKITNALETNEKNTKRKQMEIIELKSTTNIKDSWQEKGAPRGKWNTF